MKETVYTFSLKLDWNILNKLQQIDRFDATWSHLESREGKNLKQLRTLATIRSVGASTRIEGSNLSDSEVQILLENLDISKIEDRDTQEVVGYYNVLDIILESYKEIPISTSNIKNLHNQLLKLSKKDDWHKGEYKKHSNVVEANFPDGTRQVIFRTTPPGHATEDAMNALISWYKQRSEVHPLIKIGALVYDFLSIHPFQDGNGRMSRLLTTLSLMKAGYIWVQYASLEHEVENHKKDYYRTLRTCQAQRPNEEITIWIHFFLDSLIHVQKKLENKLLISGVASKLSQRQKAIYTFISDHSGSKSGEISRNLDIPSPTVKRILAELVSLGIIEKFGKGPGTNYSVK